VSFAPRLDILPAPQRRLWEELGEVPPEFVLYGDTAIALHLGHRESVDFDFFADRDIDARALLALPMLRGAVVTQDEPNTLGCEVDRGGPVRLSFFGVPALPRLAAPLVADGHGLRVASLRDLAGTKIAVLPRRAEAKDYLDVDAILRDGSVSLAAALDAARALYGDAFNAISALKALVYFEDGSVARLPADVKGRLRAAVAAFPTR
jgi:hypothetical protein